MEDSLVTKIISQLVLLLRDWCCRGGSDIPSAIQTNVGDKDDQGHDDRSQVEQKEKRVCMIDRYGEGHDMEEEERGVGRVKIN